MRSHEIATGDQLDRLAEYWSNDIRRMPGETDSELRDRLRAAIECPARDSQAELERRIRFGYGASMPVVRFPIDVDPEIFAATIKRAPEPDVVCGCGTCSPCRRYKGER